jgi:hypothetical protein
MKTKQLALAGCAILAMSVGAAQAGPCNMTGRADAGSGPTPGSTSSQTQTTIGSTANEHPPTRAMNSATAGTATSSEDAQKQMQGEPPAAQQAQRDDKSASDQGC